MTDARRRRSSWQLVVAAATLGVVLAMMTARVHTMTRTIDEQDLGARLSAVRFVLDEEASLTAAATRRLAGAPDLARFVKEADPFRLVIAVAAGERRESLDVCYVVRDGRPLVEGATLHVLAPEEVDTAWAALPRPPRGFVRVEHEVERPRAGELGFSRGFAAGFWAFDAEPIVIRGSVRGELWCGRRLAPQQAFHERLVSVGGPPAGGVLTIRWGGAVVDVLGREPPAVRGRDAPVLRAAFAGSGELAIEREAPLLTAALLETGALALGGVAALAALGWRTTRATVEIARLQRDEAQRDRAMIEAQMLGLRAQMQPHFLFNTLHSVHQALRLDVGRAGAMVLELAALLRATLTTTGGNLATLGAELDIVRHYLKLQQLRFGERLVYEIAPLPATAADVRVPALMLQSLVENAVKHGVEPSLGGGRVEVVVTHDAAATCLRVANTGAPLADAAREGVGLANVRERLRLTFGASAGFTLEREGDWTVATVRLA
jgi:signal transduction histidine kinase